MKRALLLLPLALCWLPAGPSLVTLPAHSPAHLTRVTGEEGRLPPYPRLPRPRIGTAFRDLVVGGTWPPEFEAQAQALLRDR